MKGFFNCLTNNISNEGMDPGDIDGKLQQKIEELILYLIAIEKKNG